MTLQLINTYVSKLDFKILDESEIDASKEKNFKLDFSTSFGEIKNQFAIIFDIDSVPLWQSLP
jgi:hypothetical protein